MTKTIAYLSASPYSGSTLLAFLLNTHPQIVTIGHTTGWDFGANDAFPCSCGEPLAQCGFYREIAAAFRAQGLPFSLRDFGTDYRLAASPRLNRLLTTNLSRLTSTRLERLRDGVVQRLPWIRGRLARQDRANQTLIGTVLARSGARVFVDNSHDPYRLRHLRRLAEFRLLPIHLVRDPRGVAYSNKRHKGWDVVLSSRLWLRRQADIVRIFREFPKTLRVYYDDLCDAPDPQLAAIHRFLGLDPQPFGGNFKAGEHHILGNDMRLLDGQVRSDSRWQSGLTPDEAAAVDRTLTALLARHPDPALAEVVQHFLQRIPASGGDAAQRLSDPAQSPR
ncbi:MAG: sulfotransferase [Pseudomonadota bacterium]|nr:sulfotransferase [Pseudomonadota bacterium]